MRKDLRLAHATLAVALSFLFAVCLPYLVLTLVAPGARSAFLCFAFGLWALGLRPADRMVGRLPPTLNGAKPRKATDELGDLA